MRMNKKKSISIIIPVFNSQATIYLLIKNLIAELDKNLEFEIILINDNSTDSSESECINASTSDNLSYRWKVEDSGAPHGCFSRDSYKYYNR